MSSIPIQLPSESSYWEFASGINVISKETGFGPVEPWGTQRRLIHAIFEGLKQDIRQFIVLKAGQVGATTEIQKLSQFWYHCFPGIQGVCVADSDELRDFCRDNMTIMLAELDEEGNIPDEDPKLRRNNKNMISFRNAGRLLYQTSGARSGNRLGVGRGFALGHCTEVALWSKPAAHTYLRTRWADKHPARLFIDESTARGRNWFYDLWVEADDAVDIQRIFLAWWMNEQNSIVSTDEKFLHYWDDKLDSFEQRCDRDIQRRYQTKLAPEQWAWRRWYLSEKAGGDERVANQEMPFLPEQAFEASGESFLGYHLIQRCRTTVKKEKKPQYFRYEFAQSMEDSRVLKTTQSNADLLVWEEPESAQAYVVAAVPANSSREECDTGVVSIWRATRDEIIQVAEFASTECGLQTFSWVCIHLLGVYQVQRRTFILEIVGPGAGVLQELQRLQQSGWGTRGVTSVSLRKVVGPITHYLWRRPDSLGAGAALQWKSSPELSSLVLRRLQDQLDCGRVRVRSPFLVDEMERMRREADKFVSDGRTIEEHRLMAAALAVESWSKQLRPLFKRVQGNATSKTVMNRLMENVFAQLGSGR